MKVNIEVQYLCVPSIMVRGIPNYIRRLLSALSESESNTYSVSFFDYEGQRKNRDLLIQNVEQSALEKLTINECNSFSYKTFIDYYYNDEWQKYCGEGYEDMTGVKADVMHFPTSFCMPQNVSLPTVVTVHDVIPCIPEFQNKWDERSQRVFQKSMKYIKENEQIIIISDSENTKKDLINYIGLDEKRIHTVLLGFDRNIYYPDKDIECLKSFGIESEYLLYLGALDVRKGLNVILDAFDEIKKTYADLKLVIAGQLADGASPILDNIKNHKYTKDIILTGYVSETQKRILLSAAELFLFPSEYEGFGFPVLESMACGTPVITTDVTSLPEVGGDAVEYISVGNNEQLANTVMKLLGNQQKMAELRKKGFERCNLFSWKKTAEETEKIYQMIGNM